MWSTNYLEVTHLMENDIDVVEEEAFVPDHRTQIEPIYHLKREVVELRRCVNLFVDSFCADAQSEQKALISKEVRRYLRDVADDQMHAAEVTSPRRTIEMSSLVQAALARVEMQQNTDMGPKTSGMCWSAGGADDVRLHGRDGGFPVDARPEMALGLPDVPYRTGRRRSAAVPHDPPQRWL